LGKRILRHHTTTSKALFNTSDKNVAVVASSGMEYSGGGGSHQTMATKTSSGENVPPKDRGTMITEYIDSAKLSTSTLAVPYPWNSEFSLGWSNCSWNPTAPWVNFTFCNATRS
jgi:hypothetical protein